MLQGNEVRGEEKDATISQELSSTPASIEAAQLCDAFGPRPGHILEQSDAEQAYLQAPMPNDGVVTWVRLPSRFWPPRWRKMRGPVCPLVLALYGHPDSGGL